MLDFNWEQAAKRAGISKRQLHYMQEDDEFMTKGRELIERKSEDRAGVDEAIDRFRRTQKLLIDELESGELSVSNAVLKSHEMEFKMHGLFEKDNKQKGSNVSINITFDNPNNGHIEVEGTEVE